MDFISDGLSALKDARSLRGRLRRVGGGVGLQELRGFRGFGRV